MGVLSKFMVSLPYHCYEVAHPWSETCSYAWLYVFLSCVRESMKIYGILYLVSIFLFFFYMLLQNHYKNVQKGCVAIRFWLVFMINKQYAYGLIFSLLNWAYHERYRWTLFGRRFNQRLNRLFFSAIMSSSSSSSSVYSGTISAPCLCHSLSNYTHTHIYIHIHI